MTEIRFRGIKNLIAMGSYGVFALLGLIVALGAFPDGEPVAGVAALAFSAVVATATWRMRRNGYRIDGNRLAAISGIATRTTWIELDAVELVTPFEPSPRGGVRNITLWSPDRTHVGVSVFTARSGTGAHREIVQELERTAGALHPFPVLLRDLDQDGRSMIAMALHDAGLRVPGDDGLPVVRSRH